MIKVTCDCKTMLPISEIDAFQGKLKSIDLTNFNKLKESISKYGFSFPIFVWNNKILDGHQRLAAVKKLVEGGEKIDGGKLPVVNIDAKDEKEAAEKLLLINSRYAKIEQKGFDDFVANFKIDIEDFGSFLEIPDIEFDVPEEVQQGNTDPDEVPEVKEKAVTKEGDIWLLGAYFECESCGKKYSYDEGLKLKECHCG